jgi:DNA-binding FadR family transcriptional regulator
MTRPLSRSTPQEKFCVTATSPIVRRKLSQDVFDRLITRINKGEFQQGGLLPSERQLMEEFQVGRPAIREALQDLQRLGLVVITHGEGARLVQPTTSSILGQIAVTVHHVLASSNQNLQHLKDARVFFELGMVRLAAARATPDDVAVLRQCITNMESSASDFPVFMRKDMAFHRQIASISGNPVFMSVSEALLGWLSEYHVGELGKLGRERQTLEEHRQIVDRIEAHDVEGAAAAMLSHQTRAADLYQRPERD